MTVQEFLKWIKTEPIPHDDIIEDELYQIVDEASMQGFNDGLDRATKLFRPLRRVLEEYQEEFTKEKEKGV